MNTVLERPGRLASKMEKLTLSKEQMYTASDVALGLGFISILASIISWFFTSARDRSHSERFGIFVGLWVPSFFILANHLARRAESRLS
ncbi:MAG: hypothetical protein WCP06_07790 [Verrucomicrobiota bacterium]